MQVNAQPVKQNVMPKQYAGKCSASTAKCSACYMQGQNFVNTENHQPQEFSTASIQ